MVNFLFGLLFWCEWLRSQRSLDFEVRCFPIVGIWKALKAVSQRLDGRVGDRRKGSPRYPYNYNTGSATQ